MKTQQGFTFIEVIIFIMVTSLLGSVILLASTTMLQKAPIVQKNAIALQSAQQCMEWFVGQRSLNGYSGVSCPSTSVPSFCTAPSGYTVSVNVSCTTINSDANYKTVTITVSGVGDAVLSTLLANY